jgi:hypothetical protein
MKAYARFFVKGINGRIVERLGSDGVLPLDGRHSQITNHRTIRDHIQRMKNIFSPVGYKIVQSKQFSNEQEEKARLFMLA